VIGFLSTSMKTKVGTGTTACAARMACQRAGALSLPMAPWRARPGARARTPASQSSARARALPAHSAASARQATWPAPSCSVRGRARRAAPPPGGRAAPAQAAPPDTGCRDCIADLGFEHACGCRLGRLGAQPPPAPAAPPPMAALLGAQTAGHAPSVMWRGARLPAPGRARRPPQRRRRAARRLPRASRTPPACGLARAWRPRRRQQPLRPLGRHRPHRPA